MSGPRLIATTDFHYGKPGRMDAEGPIVRRGEEFEVLPSFTASAAEVAGFMTERKIAVPEADWPKLKAKTQAGWDWAQAEVARLNAAQGGTARARR